MTSDLQPPPSPPPVAQRGARALAESNVKNNIQQMVRCLKVRKLNLFAVKPEAVSFFLPFFFLSPFCWWLLKRRPNMLDRLTLHSPSRSTALVLSPTRPTRALAAPIRARGWPCSHALFGRGGGGGCWLRPPVL